MPSGQSPALELARLRRVLRLESAGTWEWDLRTQVMTWDRGHRVLFGVGESARVTPEFFLWMVHPDDRAHVQAVFELAVQTRREFDVEYRIIRPVDRTMKWIEARGYIQFEGDAAVRAGGIVLDATERRDVQRTLDAQQHARVYHAEEYALLFEQNPAPMWVFDARSLRFLEVNQAAIDAYGWSREEFLQRTIYDIRPARDHDAFAARLPAMLADQHAEMWARHVTRDGRERTVHILANPVVWAGREAWLVLARDDTERLALEEQLREARKMEAVGQLAGGIAHDFNNLLTVLIGALEFAREHTQVPQQLEHDLDDIETAAARARALVAQLLAFGKRQTLQIRAVALNDVIRRSELTMRRVLGETVRVTVALSPNEPVIQADAGQLEQVLLNLTINARDALTDPGAGAGPRDFTVETREVAHTAGDAAGWPGLATGACVELVIRDTGVGMPPEVLARAFEPFYTTKGVGTAHGLGLSSVLGVVQQLGGAMRLESATVHDAPTGRGTAVRIRFPQQTHVEPRRVSGATPAVTGSSGTVLLAEDEPSVRGAIRRMLQLLGYQVIEAADGAEALATWRAHHDHLDALVTDIRMPRMSGRELAAAIRAEAPAFPIVFASGFTDEGLADGTAADRFIDKPFTSARLRDALEAVLSRAP